MKKLNQRSEDKSYDLFADQPAAGETGSVRTAVAEHFPNAYAEASQARVSRKSTLPINPTNPNGLDQSAATGTDDQGVLQQLPADNRDPTVISHLKSAKVMVEKATVCDEHPKAAVAPRLMSASEVADYLRVSLSKVWRFSKGESDFPTPIRIGGSTRWDRQEIDRYLDRLQTRGHSGH